MKCGDTCVRYAMPSGDDNDCSANLSSGDIKEGLQSVTLHSNYLSDPTKPKKVATDYGELVMLEDRILCTLVTPVFPNLVGEEALEATSKAARVCSEV